MNKKINKIKNCLKRNRKKILTVGGIVASAGAVFYKNGFWELVFNWDEIANDTTLLIDEKAHSKKHLLDES